ncbi:MAG TPA: hypothetical protein PK331_06755 [Gordonia sp. (in: high G+C Gram-positive bacteria)]|uniref:hypothetical protein n=1 Tax=unclassified Gordonia (in: high G+C Gram-positive bacteria) TaxID=2657482 RepID=UPI000FBA0D2C|nr:MULTISPECIES: hypothetical protein [unclassified Gordonia (in: high G+C Gram-positive bacteria)]RUP35834.1 MAG: hypothetical protein EKK60_16840 [Gordonia sp. (in: high G+C Gram-positive bacteria)]HNP56134.1 hypothetical protein [Gordonia sp. (in: high G+C Gram-positive bacteria)]HRC50609.1 hypothetical protein [Gordonia sp. (in: high G+C Gram-positive bacteria)]
MYSASVPRSIRWAGFSVALQGGIGLLAAAILVIRALGGHHEDFASGYGLALWCALIGLGVLVGGIGLLRGKRWGRGIGVVAQLLLLPVAYALLTDSHQPFLGVPLGFWALGTLVALFSRDALEWAAGDPPPDAGPSEER